jgi:hypothetical protein
VSAGQDLESRLQTSFESESALRSNVAALETAMSVISLSFKDEHDKMQELFISYKAASYDDTQRLLAERAELSSLLDSLRSQLDKCKESAVEERRKLRDERFDIGCLLAAESEKCANFELKVRSLEQQLSESIAMHSLCQQQGIGAEQELKS